MCGYVRLLIQHNQGTIPIRKWGRDTKLVSITDYMCSVAAYVRLWSCFSWQRVRYRIYFQRTCLHTLPLLKLQVSGNNSRYVVKKGRQDRDGGCIKHCPQNPSAHMRSVGYSTSSVHLLPRFLPPRATNRPKRDTNGFSATLASF